MLEPQNLTHTAEYLKTLSVLKDLVQVDYLVAIKNLTEESERRGMRVKVQKQVIERLKEEKKPYIIIHFANTTAKCPHQACHIPINGVYL